MARLARLLPVALAAALGMLVGLGAYTFVYARGYSYLTDDPRACVNCHIMRDNYNSWAVSSHRSVSCNGCHTPHATVPKYLVKGENGFAHSWAFTFENPQVIRIRRQSLAVVEANCAECHQQTLAGTFLGLEEGATRAGDPGPGCTRCHASTGHAL